MALRQFALTFSQCCTYISQYDELYSLRMG
jgi:hypothetical protein